MQLVPVPLGSLEETRHIWWPYILMISERDKCDPNVKVEMLCKGHAQAFIIWDEEIRKAWAFLGVVYKLRGSDRIGELAWLAGENRAAWSHLFSELETYLREQQGCKGTAAVARKGWSKILKENGYRETYVVFEKDF